MTGPVRSRRALLIWSTLAVLVSIVLLVEFALHEEHNADDGHGHPAEIRFLLPVPVHDIAAIEIAHQGNAYIFAQEGPGHWHHVESVYSTVHRQDGDAGHSHAAETDHGHEHEKPAAAETGRGVAEHQDIVSIAMAALGRARIERELEGEVNLADFGLTSPNMLINVYVEGRPEPTGRIAIGDIAPDTVSRYALLVDQSAVVTIPNFHVTNIIEMLGSVAQ